MTAEIKSKAPTLPDVLKRLQADIDGVQSTMAAPVQESLGALRARLGENVRTKEALTAIRSTVSLIPTDSGNEQVRVLRENLSNLATFLEKPDPAAPSAKETTAKPGVKSAPENTGPLFTAAENEGVKINAPVIGPAVEFAKSLPEVAQIPMIGGALWVGSKILSSFMKMFGTAGKAVAKPVDYAAHVFGEVGLWSGTWLMLSQLYTKFSGKESASH